MKIPPQSPLRQECTIYPFLLEQEPKPQNTSSSIVQTTPAYEGVSQTWPEGAEMQKLWGCRQDLKKTMGFIMATFFFFSFSFGA